MAPTINTDDSRAIKILDAAGIKYTLSTETTQTPVAVTDPGNVWTIEGVNYRGKIIPVVLSKELLPAMNLSQMTAYAKKAMKTGEPYSANAQLVYAIAKRAKKQGNTEVREFMKDAIFSQYPNTLSVVRYNPGKKLDEIVHNPGLSNEYSSKVSFVSPDEWVNGSTRKEDYKMLLGSNKPADVDDVFEWITGKSAYMYKVNAKPDSVDERVVRLNADSGWFGLDCVRYPQGALASFGVSLPQKI
ncbi:MAG: hypothetical protein AABX85_00510 [Nanoarchaeota archaeon]